MTTFLRVLLVATCLPFGACTPPADPDLCPDDPAKTEGGACGCGASDADGNRNGVPDCFDAAIDLCPDDTAKRQAGSCGCGTSDADANGNGVPDCLDAAIDLCPDDAAKTTAGTCGCGTSDADGNTNGVPDCLDAAIDLCPNDSSKTQAGTCGCGTSDADGNSNGVPDCLDAAIDLCPTDPNKTQAGACGCGTADVDANANGVPDCLGTRIAVAYASEWTIPTNLISGTGLVVIINTSAAPLDLSAASIRNVTVQPSTLNVTPSIGAHSGILPVGQRVGGNTALQAMLNSAGLTPEPISTTATFNTGLTFMTPTTGDYTLSYTLDIGGRTVPITVLIRVVASGQSITAGPLRVNSTPG